MPEKMSLSERFFGHLRTINRHKMMVTTTCIRVGLIRQGLAHDLSKYAPVEFLAGVHYYQGTRSPIHAEKKALGYSAGWLHHKGRNRHHFEYWIDYAPNPAEGLKPIKMPKKYVAEMAIDRICASRNYQGAAYTQASAWNYYEQGKSSAILHPESDFLLAYLLKMTKVKGEETTYRYIRHVLLKNRDGDYHVINGRLVYD